ncbi:MAG: DUF3821 domain-containing protein, partial [Methanospirillum sp.]|uniref:DUF3821 domain-containing protein n=1 Tax=Methanospirillum sp. TaxID=45200 RepID=UPI002375E99C
VYVGETDLDVSECNVRTGDEIAWWESGNPQGTPTARAKITDTRHFTVDKETFSGHTGKWYELIGKKSVFSVEEPTLEIDLNENGIDTVPASIKRGNLVSFKISTNMAGLSQRAGSSGVPVTINMTGPNDTVYHTLKSTRTEEFNLDKVYAYTSPYDTGAVWDTSDEKKFPDGDYTISAITNINKINENNPDTGKTSTEKKTYTLGKSEIKPTETESEKSDKNSKDKGAKVSAESTTKEKKSVKGSETPTEEPTEEITSEPTQEEKTSKSASTKEQKPVKGNKTVSKEPTEEVTSEPTNEGKTNKTTKKVGKNTSNLTTEKTFKPTPEITEVQTTIATPEPTPEVTDEPTPVITPHPKKTYPHPPSASATPTQTSPLPVGLIITAISAGILLFGSRRYQ